MRSNAEFDASAGLTEAPLAVTRARLADVLDQLELALVRLAEANDRAVDAERRLRAEDETIARLTRQIESAESRLLELESQLAGTGPLGLAVARRLARLSARFPLAARGTKRILRAARGVRRAA
jgi:chromosome segregation ATPase